MTTNKCTSEKLHFQVHKMTQKGNVHTHVHRGCEHRQILDLVEQHAGNFLTQFHGPSASYSNFPWHTWNIKWKSLKKKGQ